MLEEKIKNLFPTFDKEHELIIRKEIEGYKIFESRIEAHSERLAFYALIDAAQGVKEVEQKEILTERGVHVDMGRKYFSKKWFYKLIEMMARNKLNRLQIHISENEGFRLKLPGYESLCSNQALSYQDMQDIIQYASKYYIEVIPSFDTPGHLKHILKSYPQYRLKNSESALDITNPKARLFIKGLLSSVMDCFKDSKVVHIGGDEFIPFDQYEFYPDLETYAKAEIDKDATGSDVYIDYINDIGKFVMQYNKIPRIWNDGMYRLDQKSHVSLNANIQITYWTSWHEGMAPLHSFITHNHDVLNFMDENLYFVLGECAGYSYPNVDKMQNSFNPYRFPNRHKNTDSNREQWIEINHKQNLGSYFSIWCDDPEAMSELEVNEAIEPILKIFGGKLWE